MFNKYQEAPVSILKATHKYVLKKRGSYKWVNSAPKPV
jgi:hypothetical protein